MLRRVAGRSSNTAAVRWFSDGPKVSTQLGAWRKAWVQAKGQPEYHLNEVNGNLLLAMHEWLPPAQRGSRVLVPLCGRSVDMSYLERQGHFVVGVEGADVAVQAVAEDYDLHEEPPLVPGSTRYKRFTNDRGSFTVLLGDFLDVTAADCGGKFTHAWDRAAMTAMAPSYLPRYVAVLRSLMEPGGMVLLETLTTSDNGDYSPERVATAVDGSFEVELLNSEDVKALYPHSKQQEMWEHIMILTAIQ